MIGFERTSYTVLEAAGLVRVAVVVLEGEEVFSSGMVDSVRLRLHTQSGSALGTQTLLQNHSNNFVVSLENFNFRRRFL